MPNPWKALEWSVQRTLLTCTVAALVMASAMSLPPLTLFAGRPADHASVHLLLELFSVVVSIMVVSLAWHTLRHGNDSSTKALLAGFTLVAGLDVLHALSFEYMPSLFSDASTGKAIFFWLGGRVAELMTIVLVAAGARLPGGRAAWLAAAIAGVISYGWLGTFHLDWFPTLFIPGHGVSPLKARLEYLLCASNLAAACWFFLQRKQDPEGRFLWLAASTFIMGIGELAFTNYVATSDFLNVFGHLFKTVAYGFIYRATFYASVERPHRLLERSSRQLQEQQLELQRVLRNVPVEIVALDASQHCRYANPPFARRMGRKDGALSGLPWRYAVPTEWRGKVEPLMARAMAGQHTEADFAFTDVYGAQRHVTATVVPERGTDGALDGVLAIFADTTEREIARRRMLESMEELSKLKDALDAHAIVAVTDAQGVIIHVNDKFCTISKYARSELLGRTHSVVNSGHHPRAFFQDLWRTIGSGKVWSGEICNRAKDGSLYWVYSTIVPFIGADGIPNQYIAIRADITERKHAEQAVQRLAFYDTLTSLPNRLLLIDRLKMVLAQGERSGQYGALLSLDLDDFKGINDTLGHEQGDELLRQVARRLQSRVRKGDTVARMGGDEFILVLPELGHDHDTACRLAEDLAGSIRDVLAVPFYFNDLRVDSSCSIGLVMFDQGGVGEEELLKQADMALYRAKAQGKNRVHVFAPALQEQILATARLLADLRVAQQRDELRLFYQPVVGTARELRGYEALIRWQHPDKGMVSPVEFIPLAEQSGLILSIGHWVLRQACLQLADWRHDPARAGLTVAVNVSARQMRDAGFVEQVKAVLDETGANPGLLRLELTESMFHADLEETVGKMHALRTLGVRFSLDDFGTGYSSLSYLRRLPLYQLKIDRSFVTHVDTDSHDAAIARTILALAATLGLRVVAEGVETPAQFAFLAQLGCDAFQGYLFGKPALTPLFWTSTEHDA
ncbi:EAL domain-containing protein [Duganella sp. LX20W]|uniref:EAL domain-containing protein n=2 Tax=Rugamonas brunnea TaxID=2758569 RepID=A0A7W2IEB0_9BURK|nr:EAL domain-containing protein [Rugamonas brunnea]